MANIFLLLLIGHCNDNRTSFIIKGPSPKKAISFSDEGCCSSIDRFRSKNQHNLAKQRGKGRGNQGTMRKTARP